MVTLKTVVFAAVVGMTMGQFNQGQFNQGQFNQGQFNQGQFNQGQFNQPRTPPIPILYDEREGPDASGSYSFRYETGDGIRREESARPTGLDTLEVQGSYTYTAPDGTPVEVRYVADEFGFRAESPLLPTPPPMPAHALQQIAAAEEAFARQRQEQQPQQNFQQQSFQQPQQNFQQLSFPQQQSFQQQQQVFQQPQQVFQQQSLGNFQQQQQRGFQTRRRQG